MHPTRSRYGPAGRAAARNSRAGIGGFSPEKRYETKDPAHLAEWRELSLRWFQHGAFVPIFRLHGQFPYREIWEIAPEGTPHYDSFVHYLKLRYTLLPYIYTLAGDTYHRDGSMMRGMAMDFPGDPKVRDINDQSWRSDLLGRLLKNRNAHVNLIPLNPTPGSKWTASRPQDEKEFVRILEGYGVAVTVRDTRGREIDGACGQLAAAEKGKSE